MAVLWFVLAGSLLNTRVMAEDWPMWRCDAGRTAASGENLPPELHPQWSRQYSPRQQAWDDPLNLDLMTYDRLLEPIVVKGRLFVGFNDRDKISALDAVTGKHLWDFFADAPVRLPLAATDTSVFCSSDDGLLYCVDVETGQLKWSFRGGPSNRKAIGNQRLVSAWPTRGGPVLRDGRVYFASSIWPFMGVFIYCLDAESGDVVWVNDDTGSQYIRQPHSAPSFAGVGPQGALVATEQNLVIPGGRSVPAVLDRHTGALRYFEINAGGKGTGGSFVAANEESWFVHTRLKGTREFQMDSGLKTAFMPNEPVLSGDWTYSAEVDKGQPVIRAYDRGRSVAWQVEVDGRGDLILAGDVLYAASSQVAVDAEALPVPGVASDAASTEGDSPGAAGTLTAVRLPSGEQPAQILWTMPVPGQVERLVAANGMLFAVTLDGALLAYGATSVEKPAVLTDGTTPSTTQLKPSDDAAQLAGTLLAAGDAQGYAMLFGANDDRLVQAMAAQSRFQQLAVIDSRAERVAELRRDWDQAGIYGRVTAHVSTPSEFMAPPYVANMIFVGRELSAELSAQPESLKAIYESVRPYGGVLQLLADEEQRDGLAESVRSLNLEQAEVQTTAASVVIRRTGALPGSADWTHQHGNIANTIKSDDKRVKLPLGILWFGGNSNTDILPRHGHGPPEQVVGGRLIVQGMNSLSARDVYTGRVLWKREFSSLGTYGVYYDETYADTPLNPAYNQVHIPGANARGTNYVVTADRIYVVEGSVCRVLDPANGEILQTIELPQANPDKPHEWGFIGVYEDVLIGGVGFAEYRDRLQLTSEDVDGTVTAKRAVFGSRGLDRAGSQALVGFDRHTGQQLWKHDAVHSFWHNGIVAGNDRVFVLDKNPKPVEEALRRRGRPIPATYRILSFDVRTGELAWETKESIFGTWLGYSETHDLLLQAGAAASDRLAAEVGQGMTVYHGKDGAIAWKKDALSYSGPCILHNDVIITNANSNTESAGAFYLRDGSQKMVANPLTGKLQPWKITRAYGCNSIIASEHLLTFRSGAAGYYDLLTESGTGNLGGFKSGCTSNLVVANGVLNAPDYTRTCSCAYQNQTSLALVHMPELEMWTVDNAAILASNDERIQQLGINFGAPGDRRDQQGLVWLEYPAVAGDSPNIAVGFDGSPVPYQSHPTSMNDSSLPWVVASGVEGIQGVRVGLFPQRTEILATGLPIAHADDDAEESPNGDVNLTSSDLELVRDADDQIIGLRFEGINLARATDIRSAALQLTCDAASDEATELIIRAELSDNAARFSDRKRDLSSRLLTAAQVVWTPAPWAKTGEAAEGQRTPDLAPLIREVVSQEGWKPGHSIAFIITGKGKRAATSFAKNGAGAARLIVDADETSPVPTDAVPELAYSLKLYFGTPGQMGDARRVFDVVVQGKTVLENVTLGGDSGPREFVSSLDRVLIGEWLDVRLVPKEGSPVLSGIALKQLRE